MATNEEKILESSKIIDTSFTRSIAPRPMFALGVAISRKIKRRTRVGKGVEDGKLTSLKKLSRKYKKRRGKSKHLSSKTTPSKSNLTATGELLDSLQVRSRRGEFFIYPSSSRGKDLSGNISKATNQDKTKYQEKQGRVFLELADSEIKAIKDSLSRSILKRFDKLYKPLD